MELFGITENNKKDFLEILKHNRNSLNKYEELLILREFNIGFVDLIINYMFMKYRIHLCSGSILEFRIDITSALKLLGISIGNLNQTNFCEYYDCSYARNKAKKNHGDYSFMLLLHMIEHPYEVMEANEKSDFAAINYYRILANLDILKVFNSFKETDFFVIDFDPEQIIEKGIKVSQQAKYIIVKQDESSKIYYAFCLKEDRDTKSLKVETIYPITSEYARFCKQKLYIPTLVERIYPDNRIERIEQIQLQEIMRNADAVANAYDGSVCLSDTSSLQRKK